MNIIKLSYQSVNFYLIPSDNGWVMIDTGWPGTFSQLLQLLNQHNISVNEINYLIITHFHPDHAGLTQNLKNLGTNLIVLDEQVPYIHKLNLFYKKNPKANFIDITGSNCIVISEVASRSFLETIGIHGQLITTPGHSDDSISIILDSCCAFVGDLPSFFSLDEYDDLVLDDSWDMIMRQHVKMIYPGHGDPYEITL